ncbi:MAG: transglycosylase domain-containing protein [Myxococcota bacterium]
MHRVSMADDDSLEGCDGISSFHARSQTEASVTLELQRIRERLNLVMARLEPIEAEVQALELTSVERSQQRETEPKPSTLSAPASAPPNQEVGSALDRCGGAELRALPEPPTPPLLSPVVSVDASIPERRPPRPPESVTTRPLTRLSVIKQPPAPVTSPSGPAKPRRLVQSAFMLAALALLGWGGLSVGASMLAERLEGRLVAAGLTGHVTVDLGLESRVMVEQLATREPIVKRGIAAHVGADELVVSVDLVASLLGGAWLTQSTQLHGPRVALSQVAEGQEGSASFPELSGAALHDRLRGALARWCPRDCLVSIADASVSWDGAGLAWPGWSGVDGELRVTSQGTGRLALRDRQERTLTLSAGFTDWLTSHTLTLTGRHEGQLNVAELGLDKRLPWPEGVAPLEGSLTGLTIVDGVLSVEGLEARTQDASGRRYGAHIARLSVPRRGSLTETLEGLVIEGVSATADLSKRGGHLASAERISFEGPGLYPCVTERWCPSRVKGARVTMPAHPERWSALAMEAGEVAACGAECVSVRDGALEVRRGTESLNTAWRNVKASWEAGALAPYDVHLDGGHADVRLAFEGLAKDHQGALLAVAPQAFDAASALSAFSLRPTKQRRGKRPSKEEETGRLIRTLVQTLDGLVEEGLARWPTLQAQVAQWSDSERAELSLADARYTLTLGELPELAGRVERLEARVVDGLVTASSDARLVVPEVLHLPESVRTTSMPASYRGLWGGPGLFEGHVSLTYRDGDALRFSFDGRTPWLYLAHERIALERIEVAPLELRGAIVRRQGDANLSWELDGLELVATRGGRLNLSAGVTLERDRKRGRLALAAELPMQDCGALHKSIPPAMLYGLQGARFRGEAGLSVSVDYPLHAVEGLKVAIGADFEGCVAETLGEGIDVADLNASSSVFHVYDHRLNKAIRVGPGTGNWVSLSSMPAHVWGAAMATEDFNFFSHEGFSKTFIGRALRLNLRTRRYAYGGSTITQQLVKNLFLTRHKTLARKLVEAVLVWQVERHVSKRRILALYVNCIEYGPRIYGIRNAARRYFNTVPSRLSPVESAFIMNIKPFPWTGYWIFKKRMLTSFFAKRAEVIKQRLLGRGYISAEQAEGMLATNLYTRFMDTF